MTGVGEHVVVGQQQARANHEPCAVADGAAGAPANGDTTDSARDLKAALQESNTQKVRRPEHAFEADWLQLTRWAHGFLDFKRDVTALDGALGQSRTKSSAAEPQVNALRGVCLEGLADAN